MPVSSWKMFALTNEHVGNEKKNEEMFCLSYGKEVNKLHIKLENIRYDVINWCTHLKGQFENIFKNLKKMHIWLD